MYESENTAGEIATSLLIVIGIIACVAWLIWVSSNIANHSDQIDRMIRNEQQRQAIDDALRNSKKAITEKEKN